MRNGLLGAGVLSCKVAWRPDLRERRGSCLVLDCEPNDDDGINGVQAQKGIGLMDLVARLAVY